MSTLPLSLVNSYLAHKQHLLPARRASDVLQVTRDIVALHGTSATTPYLSLFSRSSNFTRAQLDHALYEQRTLARVLCMRATVHIVPSDQVDIFIQGFRAYIDKRTPAQFRGALLLAHAGLCDAKESEAMLSEIQQRMLAHLRERGPSTLQEISESVPELGATIRYGIGKAYEGQFSVGSRLVNDMTAEGLIIRTRPRGTWRSTLYEYAELGIWLPEATLEATGAKDARAAAVRRYVRAFGPVSLEDIRWWAGLTKRDAERALAPLAPDLVSVSVEGLDQEYTMLTEDAQRLRSFTPPAGPYVFLLPSLDPYIMGYRERGRFMEPEDYNKVLDRSGNALPTVWVDGRVVGAWSQSEDAAIVYGLFRPISPEAEELVDEEIQRLQAFLGDDTIAPAFFHTPFTRALSQQ